MKPPQPRPPKTLATKSDRYDHENLAIARAILATDEQGIRREWARLVVERKGTPK